MKSHLFISRELALALALGIAGAAYGEQAEQNDQPQQTNAGSAYAAETMEHLEAVAYPVPELITEEATATNKYLTEEQTREQFRQELLLEHNRKALLDNVRNAQLQQVKAFVREGQEEQQVAQESTPLVPVDAATPALESAVPAVLDVEEADRSVPAAEVELEELQTESEQAEEPEQEPS